MNTKLLALFSLILLAFSRPISNEKECESCILYAEGTVKENNTIIFPLDLEKGKDFSARLNVSCGKGSLSFTNVTNLKCRKNVCKFTSTSKEVLIGVKGLKDLTNFILSVY